MESEKNNHPHTERKNVKDKIKSIPIYKQYLDDSETNEKSLTYKNENSEKNNSLIEEVNKTFKKSIGFFSKKIYIEKPEPEEKKAALRKYSMEQHLVVKDFVPQLKPIEIHLVPSKLRLNQKGFRDLKCNKDNKLLLISKKYFISCPNSEEESDFCPSPIKYSSMDKNTNIKKTRRSLKKMKSGSLPRVLSRNIVESNCKIYKDDMKIESDSQKEDSFYLDDENLLLYDDNDFFNYKMNSLDKENNKENKKEKETEKEEQATRNNRINSCSILDVLKNRISFDDSY